MPIYKRGKYFWIRFTTPGGQRIRRSTGTVDRKAAEEFHDRTKAELWRRHNLGEKERRSWQQAVVRWLREKQHKADIRNDKAKFRYLDSYFGQLYLDQIDRDIIDAALAEKVSTVRGATVNRYSALIRSVLRAARDDWQWIQNIPTVKLLPESKKRVRWLTTDEARRLVRELPEHLADMTAFALSTGLRRGNVTGLEWEQVSLGRRTAWIHPDQSKSGKAIAVPLNDDALAILNRRDGQHPTYVFTYQGKRVHQTSTKAWYSALQRAGISDFKWHDTRHCWSSWHIQNGTTLAELMELGGWSSYEMVLRYAHLSTGQLSEAAKRVDGMLSSDEADNTDSDSSD